VQNMNDCSIGQVRSGLLVEMPRAIGRLRTIHRFHDNWCLLPCWI